MPQIYILVPDSDSRLMVQQSIERSGRKPLLFSNSVEFFQAAQLHSPGCLVVAENLGESSSRAVQSHLTKNQSPIGVVVLADEIPAAVEAMRLGAATVIARSFEDADLIAGIQAALESSESINASLACVRENYRRFQELSEPEIYVVWRLIEGFANKAIAKETQASVRTIERRRSAILRKMNTNSVPELAIAITRLQEASLLPWHDEVLTECATG